MPISRKRAFAAAVVLSLGLFSVAPLRADAPGDGASQCPAADRLAEAEALALGGDPGAALPAYAESRRLADAEGDALLAARAGAGEARAAVESGRLEGLEASLATLVAAAAGLPPERGSAPLLVHLARTQLLLAERRPAARAALVRGAAETLTRAESLAGEAGDVRTRSYALGYLGEIHAGEGRIEEALALTRRALFEAQRGEAPDALYRWQWQIGRLQRDAGRGDEALAAYRRTVATLDELRTATAFSSEHAASLRSEVAPIYRELVDLLLLRAADTSEEAALQALLVEARNTEESLKAAELRDYFADECLDAQRRASPEAIPGAVVVYPIPLPDRLELIVGRGGRLSRYSAPVDSETLTAEVRTFRRLLEKRTTRQFLPHAATLYDWLIRPIEPALEGGEIDALVFVPGGALRTIPFGALRDRESKRYLIEMYPLAVTPGLTLTEPRPIDRGSVRLLAAGISEAVQGYPALAGVPGEIESVNRSFPGRSLLDSDFEIARFEATVEGQPFSIVHIASHGEFAADVSESFLLAYDGKYSMDRLAELVGTTRFREDHPLELLTLSACQTATGDDRAALGLAGVALRAGARSALATLWSVHDRASADLIAEFYTQLENPERSRAQALQRAQIKVMGNYAYRHPGYWSPFLLISSWL